jgi:glycosyltransferase involved in cell wall biosynthesis
MTRVVHVVVAGEIGGAERMLVDLASQPERTGAASTVAVLSPNEAVPDLFRAAGLRVVGKQSPEGPLAFLWQAFGPSDAAWIAEVLRAERAEVAHLHTFASQVVGTRAASMAGVPVLRTEHSTRAFVDPSCWPFARWSLARATASVAVSRHVRSVALARAPWAAERMTVVPNGVDFVRFGPSIRAATGPLRLAIVGRLEPRKGVDMAIECVSRVPEVALDVVGDGPLRSSLQRLARARGAGDRVRFLGFVDDVRPAIAACHAVLCTSRTEGLGLALIEAMGLERPVLGFEVGGVAEIVDAELANLLTPEGDIDALTASVRRASTAPDRLAALGTRARRVVTNRFSLEAMHEGYRRAYAGVVDGATLRQAR